MMDTMILLNLIHLFFHLKKCSYLSGLDSYKTRLWPLISKYYYAPNYAVILNAPLLVHFNGIII